MQCRAVIQQPVAAVVGFDHLMNPKETAHGLDAVQTGLPQTGYNKGKCGLREEAGRAMALKQHDGGKGNENDLERQLCRGRQANAERELRRNG
jgi:hypothetical protein